ncbi:MAG: site-specific integrase [Bacilli bacterium]|nr:site-specific integrase [Bacilli bacterium]
MKIKGFRRPPKEIHTIWNFQQYEAFRKTLKDTEEKAFFDLLYYGGLRRGEALALLDTDLIGGDKIAITKTFSKGETTTTKTNAGTRIVKLPPEIYAELEEQAEKKGKLFRGLSFTSLKRTLDRGAKKAELPRARIHDLRHSHITMLLYQGITPQGIAHRVGQADTNTLFNTYAGYLTREDDTICSFLEKEIKKSTRLNVLFRFHLVEMAGKENSKSIFCIKNCLSSDSQADSTTYFMKSFDVLRWVLHTPLPNADMFFQHSAKEVLICPKCKTKANGFQAGIKYRLHLNGKTTGHDPAHGARPVLAPLRLRAPALRA